MELTAMAIAAFSFTVSAAVAQNCAYTYTFTKPPSFAFCITPYGTIGMIQSPIGTNHLDATNPVEGFAWIINDSSGGTAQGTQIPGLGFTNAGTATFSEPKGSGRLPLIANMSSFTETITADPIARTITLTLKVRDCGPDCEWEGNISRVANAEMDGKTVNSFASSKYAGFAFLNHGLMLSMPEFDARGIYGGCGGVDPNGASEDAYQSCGGSQFTGSGAIYAEGFFSILHTHSATYTYTYRVF